MSIFSENYETELHVVDIQTNRIDKFGMTVLLIVTKSIYVHNYIYSVSIPIGQNRRYFTKALLIYDGIHYDPLVCQTGTSHVTTFTVDDEQIALLALNMAKEAQQVCCYNTSRV